MPVKLKFLIVFFLLVWLTSFQLKAQDEGQANQEIHDLSQQHPELNLVDDKTLLIETDAKLKNTSASHETNNTPSTNKKPDQNKPSTGDKPDDDPLSFNFLYFIIQKYKISDIVDD